MSDMDAAAYLKRIGYSGPLDVDAHTLAGLQRAHLLTVPFDALDCCLGQPVTPAPEDAYRKVVEHRRGGFCFELNGLFGWLLTELGFRITFLGARVVLGDKLTAPYSHLALMVELDRRWLVDVGFGRPFALEPLDIDTRGEQPRGDRRFRVVADGASLTAEELGTSEPRAYQFSLDPAPRHRLAEQCRFYASDSRSPLVRFGPVSRLFDDGWVTVTRARVTGDRGGVPLAHSIHDEAHWRAELRHHTGLSLRDGQVRGTSQGP